MLKNSSKRVVSLLMAIIMLIGIMPVTAIATGSVTNYDDFLANLKVLEGYAEEYHTSVPGSADPGELVLNFIRTGVERYQDDNWTTLAGQEIVGFTSYVEAQDTEKGTTAMNLRDIVIDDFKLPNENKADFGHMFGCMNISYVAKGSADLSGWAGDLCDLLDYCVRNIEAINANTDGTVASMTAYIRENCFGVDASDAFGWDDFYGDMDAYYFVSEYQKGSGSFSELMEAYYTADLSDEDRAVYFVNNRFGVEDTQEAVRKAIYESYSADVGIKVLESGRGLSSYNALREACCYALADYLFEVAGGKGLFVPGSADSDVASNGYYSVFSNEHSILAPGIEQDINYAQTVDGKQIVYYVATVDVTRDDVTIMANYKDNDPSKGWGLQKVADQVAALVANQINKVDENGNKVYENFNAIVATNGDGYNITNGTPGGLLVMEGVEWHAVDGDGFFAILKDGSAMIGTQAEYETHKDQIQEAIGGFGAVLVKDGKINVTKNANYTSNRASRTAIGITAEGKVVMMVLDGRQLPRSAGGAMEEIAQIMLEAGCVHAINLDGGGSTTYLSKPAGKDDIELVNVPSDGYERNVAVSLVAVSTAAPSTALETAIISSDYNYITAGTSMQLSVTGVSNTGNAAVIPEGSYWRVSDESIGTITEDGVFTAAALGEVTVEYIVNGEVKGSKVINVVIPDDIKFVEDRITAIYGEPKEILLTLWYQGYPVAFTPMQDAVILFMDTEDVVSPAGEINGMYFTGDESSGIRIVSIIGILVNTESELVSIANINLYNADEATFDFDNATQGNRKFAWNREIENAKSTDNQLYRISDPDSPVEIEYTFALDMTSIDIPAQLEPLKSMLPTYQEDATAWTYLLQLAERVCTQTNVTIRAEFSKDLEVDISELNIINDYFTLTSINLDENNVLTIVCNWNNQSQPIDAATANPLCILTGIKATVKDTAAYYNNEVLIANNGYVSYDIYLAASSLYSFASEAENQATYGLYPYIHEEDCRSDFSDTTDEEAELTNNDKGAHFSSQYIDFADIFIINNEIRQGWHEEDNAYYYYVDNVALTGTQLVPDRTDSTQRRFYEFDETGKLVSEQGSTGLIIFEDNLYYAVLGVAQTGWQQIDGNNYYFHLDTGKALDGNHTIKERRHPTTTDPTVGYYNYTFTDYILTRGDLRTETEGGTTGIRYRWAGDWMKACWFEVDGNTYHVTKNWPYFVTTGYAHYIVNYPDVDDYWCYLFDENGVLQKDYIGPADVVVNGEEKTLFFKNGSLYTTAGLIQGTDGYYYFVKTDSSGTIVQNGTQWVGVAQNGMDWTNGLVSAGTYSFDEKGRLYDPPILSVVDTHKIGYTVIGKVVTVSSESAACKVAYLKDGVYVAIEATMNADGNYNFAAPSDVNEVILILSGDVNNDGTVDAVDNDTLAASLKPGEEGLTGLAFVAADVNGNGKINSADRVLVARSLLDTDHKLYSPLGW